MGFMPTVASQLAEKGRTFTQGFVVNPLCCPSRATILSGQYSHGTGVYTNSDYSKFRPREGSTIATWLDAAGYRTGLVGKYLNGYGKGRATSVLPGWDTWRAFVQPPGYFNYSLSVDGVPTTVRVGRGEYSTDVLAGYATDFIRTVPAEEPLFLWFGPNPPHNPYSPAPRHKTALPNFTAPIYPNVNEADVSDKPAYVRRLSAKGNSVNSRKKQAQALLAVDEAVGQIVTALEDTGRLSTTFIGGSGPIRARLLIVGRVSCVEVQQSLARSRVIHRWRTDWFRTTSSMDLRSSCTWNSASFTCLLTVATSAWSSRSSAARRQRLQLRACSNSST